MTIVRLLQDKLDALWAIMNNQKLFSNRELADRAWNLYKSGKVTISELDEMVKEIEQYIQSN